MYDIFMKPAMNKVYCEDWIEKSVNGVTLSDGCSSSINTHLGSRALAKYINKFDATFMCGEWKEKDYTIAVNIIVRNTTEVEQERNLDATVMDLKQDDKLLHLNIPLLNFMRVNRR